MKRPADNIDPRHALLFGGIAGCVAKTVVAPFDRVKIHFQVANPQLASYRGKFRGVFGAVRAIYHDFGLVGLYRGHSATLTRIFPYAALNFTAFEQFKRHILRPEDLAADWPWRKLIAGSLAGTVSVTLTYPFDIIRARVAYDLAKHTADNQGMLNKRLFRSGLIVNAIRQLSRENSFFWPAGFYQGFTPTILGIIPYAGVSFFTFETAKNRLQQRFDGKPPSPLIFASGLVAGALGQTVAYPLDVLRRRLQIYRVSQHLPHSEYSKGLLAAAKAVFKEQGFWRGFYAGLSINYLKVAPASGISFLVYETLKRRLA
jgi:solute carrier family 25 protein 16